MDDMKKLMIVFTAFALLFTACRKDENVTDIDLQIPGSEEVVKIDALGIVTDIDGNVLPGTEVQLFTREGKLIGETTSNTEGRFEMLGLSAPKSPLMVFAGKANYLSTARMLTTANGQIEVIHLRLAPENVVSGASFFSPGDTTFLVLEGKVLGANGNGVPAFAVTYLNGEIFHVAVTDDDGTYQVFAPIGEVVTLKVHSACGGELFNQQVGPFFSDQTLADIAAPATSAYTISGKLTDCDGNTVTNGYALVAWSANVTTTAYVNSIGEFSVHITDCYAISPVIKITGFDLGAGTVGAPTESPFNGADLDVGTLAVCTPDDSYLTFDLAGTSYTFQPFQAFVVEDSITNPITGQKTLGDVTIMIYQSTDGQNSAVFDVAGAAPGTFFVRSMLFVLDGQPIAPLSNDPGVLDVDFTFTVHDNLPNGIVEGSFGGTFVDFTGQKTVNGTFKARQQ